MRRLFAVLLLLALGLGACGKQQGGTFQLTDVTGAPFGKALELTDHNGQRRTLADFKGKVVALFFGFTHCPDACPTTMAELATVAKELGSEASQFQVLFVTVDPERDKPEVLKQYVPAFHPSFLGMSGSPEDISRTAKEFKVYFQKSQQPGGNYTMDHSAGTFVFDKQGRLRLFGNYGVGAKPILHDVKVLLKE